MSKVVVNCPKCGKEYSMDEYKKLRQGKHVPVVSTWEKCPKDCPNRDSTTHRWYTS